MSFPFCIDINIHRDPTLFQYVHTQCILCNNRLMRIFYGSTKKLYTNECAIRIPLTILITGPKVVQSSKLQKILSLQKDKFNMQECFLLWIGLEKSATEGLFALLTQNSLDTVSPWEERLNVEIQAVYRECSDFVWLAISVRRLTSLHSGYSATHEDSEGATSS